VIGPAVPLPARTQSGTVDRFPGLLGAFGVGHRPPQALGQWTADVKILRLCLVAGPKGSEWRTPRLMKSQRVEAFGGVPDPSDH